MKHLIPVVGAVLTVVAAVGQDAAAGAAQTVVAEVNGQKLALSDLERKHPGALFQARNSFYESEKKVVQQYTDECLLEQEAQKQHVTVEQLLKAHVDDTIAKDPSEESLHVYYEGLDTTQPYEVVRGKIIDALRQRRLARAKEAYLQSLRSKASVVVKLDPPRAEIGLKDTPVRGATSPRVTIVEYADYECPYCQQAQPVLQQLETEFQGKVAFAFKDFPLPMHADAQKAAEAAHCAGAEGKYWDYHDMLFAKKQLDPASLKSFARDLKLDTAAFDKCLDSGATAQTVKAQLDEAQALGLQGTPTLFINGRYISGALSHDALRAIVEEELGESQQTRVAHR